MAIISDGEKFRPDKGISSSASVSQRDSVSPKTTKYDHNFEKNIRPKTFNEYIGQARLKETLKISIQAAKKRNEPLDHLLFYGPPGLGKTTLSAVIANEMGSKIKTTSAPALEKPRDLMGILMNLKNNDFLFIDEIHRLNKLAEEILYPGMEDFSIDRTIGAGEKTKILRIPIARFTLIGATTKAGSLSGPLRDRFGIIHKLEFYTNEELKQIVKRTASIINVKIDEDGAELIASRARGTPRIVNRLLKRIRDYAMVKADGIITKSTAGKALKLLNIDKFGLDITDRDLLKLLIEKHDGGPVGIETIAAALGEDIKTIEDVYEPYLLQAGLIARTPRGRKASCAAYEHLGYKPPTTQQNFFQAGD